MDPHPDFAGTALPRAVDLPRFRLTPLAPALLDEDFEAVMSSISVLKGLFGDWPEGLTREENLVDLAWHEREFTLRRSFSWIVRDGKGDYLGCAYLLPEPGARGRAQCVTWIRAMPGREALQSALEKELAVWFGKALPEGIALTWGSPD